MSQTEIGSFSDHESSVDFEGEQVELNSIVNKEIVVKNYEELPSNFGPEGSVFLIVQAELEGQLITFSTGSKPVIDKIRRLKDKLPLKGTIVTKRSTSGRKYYSIT